MARAQAASSAVVGRTTFKRGERRRLISLSYKKLIEPKGLGHPHQLLVAVLIAGLPAVEALLTHGQLPICVRGLGVAIPTATLCRSSERPLI